jgi:RluA family pseudouridine synthase
MGKGGLQALRFMEWVAPLRSGDAIVKSILLASDLNYSPRMAKPNYVELPTGETIPILYEDRSVLAIDKPRGWMLVPFSWQRTDRNLQAALASSIAAKDFWARSRNIRFLRFVHRLDAETTGVLLLAKSPGAMKSYSELFESRRMEKVYLGIVHGAPKQTEWTCRLKLAPDPRHRGRMKVDSRHGKEAETHFRVLCGRRGNEAGNAGGRGVRLLTSAATLLEAWPFTGRTHQIRVHLAESGHPVLGDELYGSAEDRFNLALRAVRLCYTDPFTRCRVEIRAPTDVFVREYGFDIPKG